MMPTEEQLVQAMMRGYAEAMSKICVDDHAISHAVGMKAALQALLAEMPRCEDPHSAAYCYEKLEEMRGI